MDASTATARPAPTPIDLEAAKAGRQKERRTMRKRNAPAAPAALLVGVAAAGTPTQAMADPCRPLLRDLVAYLQGSGNFVSFFHTTNYQANNYWGTAHSWGYLQPSRTDPILSGTINRTWHYSGYTETFPIEFYDDGSVRFAGQYGPYPTTCYGNKFLTVNSWDSFETFTFRKGYLG